MRAEVTLLSFLRRTGMEQHRNMRSLSVDYTHGGRGPGMGFDMSTTDVRTWLAQWPRVLTQLDTLVVGLKRRCVHFCVLCAFVVSRDVDKLGESFGSVKGRVFVFFACDCWGFVE